MLILVCYVNPPVRQREKKKNTTSVIVTGALTVSYCSAHVWALQNCNAKHFLSNCQICYETYRPVGIIYPIHVNFCYKSNSRGRLWVSGSTFHFQTVYPVLIIGLKNKEQQRKTHLQIVFSRRDDDDPHAEFCSAYSCWSNDHACPPCESHVFVILEAPADCAVTFALLPFFELLQQAKIAWNFNS